MRNDHCCAVKRSPTWSKDRDLIERSGKTLELPQGDKRGFGRRETNTESERLLRGVGSVTWSKDQERKPDV